MRNQFFFALYTTWAAVWVFVAVAYSGATYGSWRAQDGRFCSIPREIAGFVRWFFFNSYQDVRHRFRHFPEEIPKRYTSGHLLRFFITLGAFVASVMGIATMMIDRSEWSPMMVGSVAGAVSFSLVAGLGHLSVAWITKPRQWRWLIFAMTVWFPIAYQIRGLL